MDPKAKKTLEQVSFLLDKAKKEENINYMLIATHQNDGAVFFNGKAEAISMMLAENAFEETITSKILQNALHMYIHRLEEERRKTKEAKECQEKSN